VTGLVGAFVAVNLLFGLFVFADPRVEQDAEGYRAMRQFASVLKIIRKNYVDESKLEYETLMQAAMDGMLRSLDTYSNFVPVQDYQKLQEETDGEFGGIGIIVSATAGLVVLEPVPGTPGAAAGILPGDRITKVNDHDASEMSLEDAVMHIKGPPGTSVRLTLYRASSDETLVKDVARAVIEIPSVRDSHQHSDGILSVRITLFSERTAAELIKAIDEQPTPVSGLILDVRNNPGGLLGSAVSVCSLFLPTDELIVFTEGRPRTPREDHLAEGGRKYLNFPIVVIVNENSASAAEILAGCLRDHDRARLVGETSYGKGSVQTVFQQQDGSAVRLTTAKYYTPSKRVIQGHGIEPDFIVDISEEDSVQVHEQRLNRAISADEKIADLQLIKALEVTRQRVAANTESE